MIRHHATYELANAVGDVESAADNPQLSFIEPKICYQGWHGKSEAFPCKIEEYVTEEHAVENAHSPVLILLFNQLRVTDFFNVARRLKDSGP